MGQITAEQLAARCYVDRDATVRMASNIVILSDEDLDKELAFAVGFDASDAEAGVWANLPKQEKERRTSG